MKQELRHLLGEAISAVQKKTGISFSNIDNINIERTRDQALNAPARLDRQQAGARNHDAEKSQQVKCRRHPGIAHAPQRAHQHALRAIRHQHASDQQQGRRRERDEAPEVIQRTAEFSDLCPASAVLMSRNPA